MCGIIFAKRTGKKPVNKFVEEAYHKQKARGSEGFGYTVIEGGRLRVVRDENEAGILAKLRTESSNEILFHHRRPTSTDNLEFATHPIYVSSKALDFDYYVVHNGVIGNATYLKDDHEELGFKYTTEHEIVSKITWSRGEKINSKLTKFNDSESLAIELALYREGAKNTIDVSGSVAFIMYQVEKETNIVVSMSWGHNTGNPLYEESIKLKKGNIITLRSLASGSAVPEGKIYTKNYETGQVTEETVHIGTTFRVQEYTHKDYVNYEADDYYERHFGFSQRQRDPIVSLPRLPVPDDFSDNKGLSDHLLSSRAILEEKVNDAETTLDFWREEIKNVKGAERTAILAEIKEAEIKLNEATSKFDDFIEVYGTLSPYSDILWEDS